MERRILNLDGVKIETRGEGDDEREVITGHAAVFYREDEPGTVYAPFENFEERIMPGSFDRAVKEDDVRALFNHDPNIVLGRTTSGTLKLSVDKRGLLMEIDPPDSEQGRSVLESIRRGDVSGASFGFVVTDEDMRTEKKKDIREIRGVELYDVSPVTFPAYAGTDTAIRSEDDTEARRKLEEYRKKKGRLHGIRARARAIELGL